MNTTQKPNVIIILTDDQGTRDVNCFGGTHLYTPNLDALAAEGVKFTRQYTHMVCCPSRAGLLTGCYPQRNNVNNWTQNNRKQATKGVNIFPDATTMAQIYKDAGYDTMIAGKWHLGAAEENSPQKMGFDHFYGFLGGFIDNYKHCFLHDEGFHDLWEDDTELQHPEEYFPELVSQKAIAYIKEKKEKPFFLYYAMNLPHYPEQYEQQFEGYYQDEVDALKKRYYKTVSTMDAKIGEILQTVDDAGIRDNTIVLYMSDNGHSDETSYTISCDNHASGLPKGHNYASSGAGYTGAFSGCKGNALEGGIRVPCILRHPGLPALAGQTRAQTVAQYDWLPTLMGFCGIDAAPYCFDGEDVGQSVIVQDGKRAQDYIYIQWETRWCIIKEDWKLLGDNKTKELRLVKVTDAVPESVDYQAQQPALFAELYQQYLATVKDIEQDPRVQQDAERLHLAYPSAYISEEKMIQQEVNKDEE